MKTFKKSISVLLALLMIAGVVAVVPFSASAAEVNVYKTGEVESGITGDCTWTFEDGVLTISGDGSMGDYISSMPPWISYRDYLTKVIIKNGVTKIGDHSFTDSEKLNSVSIGNSVTSIGESAFEDCKSLTGIIIPDSVTIIGIEAFQYCTGLKSITIGKSVTIIDEYAFFGCTGLKSINIPDSVTSIGNNAFDNCTSLANIRIPDSVNIGSAAFYDCDLKNAELTVSNNTKIGFNAFANAKIISLTLDNPSSSNIDFAAFSRAEIENIYVKNLKEKIEFGDGDLFSVKKIFVDDVDKWRKYAFEIGSQYELYHNNEPVTDVEITPDIRSYNGGAFCGCTTIKNVVFSENFMGGMLFDYNSYTVLPRFTDCSSLETVTFPKDLNVLHEDCFYKCYNLKRVNISDLNHWAQVNFMNDGVMLIAYGNPLVYAHELYLDGKPVEEFVSSSSVTDISAAAFVNCTTLKRIRLGESVKRIGQYAFCNCKNLEEVIIEGAPEIENYAFYGCEKLKKITLPNNSKVSEYAAGYMTAEDVPNRDFYAPSSSKIGSPIITKEIIKIHDFEFEYTTPAATEQTTIEPQKEAPKTSIKKENMIKVTVKTKSVKLKKLKKKAQKVKAITIKRAQGKVRCKIIKAAKIKKYLKINSKGVITFNKWKKAKKGTYKIKVEISAAGNKYYYAKTLTKTVKVKIK